MIRMPPGRAGRLWLTERLAVADRAADVLERKARALLDEEARLSYLVERTADEWRDAHDRAAEWFLRAVLIGGERQVSLLRAAPDEAVVEARWRSTMGVTYPFEVSCRLPETDGGSALSAAFPLAAAAYRRALEAAAQHAAAQRAVSVVRHELEVTRRRLRGIRHGWLPRLTAALRRLELRLAEQEREEMVGARWAAERWSPL